jgi:hypothetical protein
MDTQHKSEHQQFNMDLNIDPHTTTVGNWYVLKRKFQTLKEKEQRDVIKLFNVYLSAKQMKYSDTVIKIRDGRVVHAEPIYITKAA